MDGELLTHPQMAHQHQHQHQYQHQHPSGAFGLITFSDTRTEADDVGGQLLKRLVEGSGSTVIDQRIVRENPVDMRSALDGMLDKT